MVFYGLPTILSCILWILVLQHAPEAALSSPLGERRHEANPIEYEPLDFPFGRANVSVSSEYKEQAGGAQVSTFRLKTFLHVENNASGPERHQTRHRKQSESRTSGDSRDSSFGLSLDRRSWNKRVFSRSRIEPNRTALDDVEYAPGEVLDHVYYDVLTKTEEGDRETERTSGLSLRDDGGWKEKPFARGFVERNGSGDSLADVQYAPGEIALDIPAAWNPWRNRVPEEDEENPKGDSGSKEDGSHRGSFESRKSSRVGSENGSDSDESEELKEYWFGPGKVEKLHFSHQGEKAWRAFPEKGGGLSRGRFFPGKAPTERQAREISLGTKGEKAPETDEENPTHEKHGRKVVAEPRQFVFHPYLPYGKDVPADEKIKFSDILPVRMVKFVKSMVEEAPWEQMFIKMVRMVVDQFVDKIIEKMFADKGHERRRSVDVFLGDSWRLPSLLPVVRVRRSVDPGKPQQKQQLDGLSSAFHNRRERQSSPDVRMRRSVDANKQHHQHLDELFSAFLKNRDPQILDSKDEKTEDKSWLDLFLDYVFPNSKSDSDEYPERLVTKRDADGAQVFRVLVSYFVKHFERTSEALTDAKDALRYKMLKDVLPYLYQKRFPKLDASENVPSPAESLQMTPRDPKGAARSGNEISDARGLARNKRSTDERSKKDEARLWQDGSRRRKPHHRARKNDCSLRRACNTGRFLARLPAVEEITMQLKSQGNEPHWDAMIWGMKKKRCSRIFCKRQRSPKGARKAWFGDVPSARTLEIVTDLPSDIDR